jgi:hypothetical protein
MIRALVERLPVMIAPRWVSIPAQPIAIQDLLEYLLAALGLPGEGSRIFEIGGADQVSYGGLMSEYARQRGLKRFILPVPFLTPQLSSLWLGLVTPLYVRVGRKLIDSMPSHRRRSIGSTEFIRPWIPGGHRRRAPGTIRTPGRILALAELVFPEIAVNNPRGIRATRRIGGSTAVLRHRSGVCVGCGHLDGGRAEPRSSASRPTRS